MLCADDFHDVFGEAVWNLESAFCILYDKGEGETLWEKHPIVEDSFIVM